MSDSDRDQHNSVVIIGVVSCLIIFGMIGYAKGFDTVKRSNAEIASKIHHEDTENRISRNCTGMDSTALAQCIERQIVTSGEYQRAEEDIYAQQSMAEWAKWLFFLTMISTTITGLVGVVVWETLKATTDSVGEMVKANQIMREGQRPWLLPKYVRFFWNDAQFGRVQKVARDHIVFDVEWMNYGNTPAASVDILVNYKFVKSNSTFSAFTFDHTRGKDIVAQSEIARTKRLYIKGLEYHGFISGELDLIVFTSVRYLDGSNKENEREYTSVFRCKYIGEGLHSNGCEVPSVNIEEER